MNFVIFRESKVSFVGCLRGLLFFRFLIVILSFCFFILGFVSFFVYHRVWYSLVFSVSMLYLVLAMEMDD
jgi:hypothetical protein